MSSRGGSGRVRVVLVACSGLLGGVIREVVSALPEVTTVRNLDNGRRRRLFWALRLFRPDVVVWRLKDDRGLAGRPECFGARRVHAVLTVLGDGDRGSLWRLRPQRTDLGALSPGTLAAAVREAGTRT